MLIHGPGLPVAGVELPDDELAELFRTHAARVRLQRSRSESWRWLQVADALRVSARAQFRADCLPARSRLGLTEWARQHDVAPSTARRWAEQGKLPTARKDGSSWSVDQNEQPKGRNHGKAS